MPYPLAHFPTNTNCLWGDCLDGDPNSRSSLAMLTRSSIALQLATNRLALTSQIRPFAAPPGYQAQSLFYAAAIVARMGKIPAVFATG